MKAKCEALLLGMLLLSATRAGATTYAVSEFAGVSTSGVGIGGSITTDGTLGAIGKANIVDWNLIGTAVTAAGVAFFDLTGPLSGNNSDVKFVVNLTATANALTLGLASGVIIPNGDLLFTSTTSNVEGDIEFSATTNIIGTVGITEITVTNGMVDGEGNLDGLIIADGKVIPSTPMPPTTTPLPAALPLFATGLGGLGLLGWRRKRKAKAVA